MSDDAQRKPPKPEIARAQALLDGVFNHAPDGVFILRWPRVLLTNPAGARILDVPSPTEAVGIDLSTRMAPHDMVIAADRIERKQTGEALPGPKQYRGRNPNGRTYDLEITSIPIEFEGEPAVLSFARDVTERNSMLRKLAVADMHAAMNTLAAGVAHEINNPLGYVLLNLEFLSREVRELQIDSSRASAMQRRVDDTRQGAERVKAIVRDLQALTRKDENIRGPVDIDQVVTQAIGFLHHQLKQRARVETHFERVPCVLGNATRLEQLVVHLLMNAAHAFEDSEAAHNLIRVTLTPAGTQQVALEVSDNGCGMDHDVLSRVFEPFFTTKPLGVGAGLGLPICKRIVDDLGGHIVVTSHPRQGTTVRVTLSAEGFRPASVPTGPTPSTARRGRLLIVDDERAVADSLRFALKDDHDVDTATSSKDARAALDAGTDYDLVLCDLVMPVESGMDLYAYTTEQHPDLARRFVFMTGGAFTPRAEKFLRDVPNSRIEKPFELDTLRAVIDDMLDKRQR
jgi:PAS domain S-box-containing protein